MRRSAFERGDCETASNEALGSSSVLSVRPEPFELLAYCDARAGLEPAGARMIDEAISRDPANWELRYGRAVVLRLRRPRSTAGARRGPSAPTRTSSSSRQRSTRSVAPQADEPPPTAAERGGDGHARRRSRSRVRSGVAVRFGHLRGPHCLLDLDEIRAGSSKMEMRPYLLWDEQQGYAASSEASVAGPRAERTAGRQSGPDHHESDREQGDRRESREGKRVALTRGRQLAGD